MGMLAGVTDCRRSQKWAAKEDGRWDLNLGPAAIEMSRPRGSEVKKGRPCGSEVKKRPRGSIVVEEGHKVLGEKEETTRLQSKWGKGPRGSEGE